MSDHLKLLRQQGFSELAYQFAAFIDRKEQGELPVVSITAALLSAAMEQGHVCLNLNTLSVISEDIQVVLPSSVEAWQAALKQAKSVGDANQYTPLILTEQGLLYLYRYWWAEQQVATAIKQRLKPISDLNLTQLQQDLTGWDNAEDQKVDWQKVAVAIAVSRQLAVISGGPGTGKTTITLKILQCLHHQSADLRIGFAAPTGKAAARFQQAIAEEQNTEVKTLHRLLGITEKNDRGRYHAEHTLPLDVLMIDEASMVDIDLMAKLMKALPDNARLILLGDSQQLASVESGAVLANLSESEQGQFTSDFIEQFPMLGLTADSQTHITLANSFVRLQHSYRFDADSGIGQLAQLVNQGEAEQAITTIMTNLDDVDWQSPEDHIILDNLKSGYQAFIDSVNQHASPEKILAAFDQFQLLSAVRKGPQSVESVNRMMNRYLASIGWQSKENHYHGQPIMVTKNDYQHQLFNGDVGVVLWGGINDKPSQLQACFIQQGELRWIELSHLPAHETVFAMTVHKSQGSEFEKVSILLPDEISPVLSRELLYTAITRAKQHVTLLAGEASLEYTIQTRHQRETGLRHRL